MQENVKFDFIKSSISSYFPIELNDNLLECKEIYLENGHLYGKFRLTRRVGERISSVYDEELRLLTDCENNYKNRTIKYIKSFLKYTTEALNRNGFLSPDKPSSAIPLVWRHPANSKNSRKQSEIVKKPVEYFGCVICGACIAKGGALKRHVEEKHDMPFETYKVAAGNY